MRKKNYLIIKEKVLKWDFVRENDPPRYKRILTDCKTPGSFKIVVRKTDNCVCGKLRAARHSGKVQN